MFHPRTIDLSPLLGSDPEGRRKLVREIGAAASSGEVFLVSHHGIEPELFEALETESILFFSQGESEKNRCYIGQSANHRGYVPVSEKGDYADEGEERHYEAFDLARDLTPEDPDYGSAHKLLGPNVWPEPASFRDAVSRYYNAVDALSEKLCEALASYLGLEPEYFARFRRNPNSQLRLIHYLENEAPGDDSPSQMGAHTDYECFTLLHQSRPGLEASLDGRWHGVPLIEGTLAVMIGDTLEAWSNGVFRSTLHRVANTGQERYSFPFFAAVDFDTVIEPLPACVDENRAAGYEPMVAGHHLLGQLFRDFPYLRRKRLEEGCWPEVPVPDHNPFESAKTGEEAEVHAPA